jgi:uncharacterized protein
MKKLIFATLIFAVNNVVFSASFDCTKAENKAEKLICLNREISDLDSELHRQFKARMANSDKPNTLIQEQRKWITERNKCGGASCLIDSYRQRISQLNSGTHNETPECPINEEKLLGTWISSDPAEFEEMAFDLHERKHAFMSWRHHNPYLAGTWILRDCYIHITHANDPMLAFEFKIKKYSRGTLLLQETESDSVFSYKRLN